MKDRNCAHCSHCVWQRVGPGTEIVNYCKRENTLIELSAQELETGDRTQICSRFQLGVPEIRFRDEHLSDRRAKNPSKAVKR